MSDQVGNPADWFSCVTDQVVEGLIPIGARLCP